MKSILERGCFFIGAAKPPGCRRFGPPVAGWFKGFKGEGGALRALNIKGKGARLRRRLCRRGVEKGSQVGQAFGVRVETAPGGNELYCLTVQRGGKGTRFVGER